MWKSSIQILLHSQPLFLKLVNIHVHSYTFMYFDYINVNQ